MGKKKVIIISIATITTILIGVVLIIKIMFFSMSRLPKGDLIMETTSPNGTYTVKTYLCNGGATVDFAVRGELIINSKNKKPRNIYWDYKISESNVSWEDDDTVIVNEHKIELPRGEYDWRKK